MRDEPSSMYDQFSGHEAPVYETSQTPFKTPHANREDLSKPYTQSFHRKAEEAPTESAPKTTGAHEWWIWFTGQITQNYIAREVNHHFDRQKIVDYDKEKLDYLQMYADELIKRG